MARQITAGNARFLNLLHSQLGIDQQQCLNFAERLLDAKLLDPLGGKYELTPPVVNPANGISVAAPAWNQWHSTAWQPAMSRIQHEPPAGFVSPPLDWFHGLNAEVNFSAHETLSHLELEMEKKEVQE